MGKHVFVDLTGDRRKAVVVLGAGLGIFLVLGLVVVLFGLLNSSPAPLPGWPDTVQRGAEIVPAPAPGPPSPSPEASTSSKTTTTSPSESAPEPSRSRGNGHGRPSKTPGKP